ncbi:peptidase E [Flaviramulus sp. BrNp1-15]|uniref:DUF6702 family protein n=1 Tax=Flaviramulus sp. BrNp1-15 TaxID=2916754 RepID=UPI001EE9605F|nr:DUF6702 family protein [Flaviramulus sp. BrNp1-15]ULC60476.1 peptidase E [Flaviramulus sp. BrNp1-15]
MQPLKYLILTFIIPLFAFTSMHKYYISVTQINHIKEKQSVQITSRIFIDDFENALRKRYDESITLAGKDEPKIVDDYIEKYLKETLVIKINNQNTTPVFIGKEYEGDIVRCYIEIEHVESIQGLEVSNRILFDVFEDQQNIVKTKINSKQKSFILTLENSKGVLNFN